jgi:catechol 2,3-dioxygenase-like lactoylglutathione lyase family enzyme
MSTTIDHIIIAVTDLPAASAEYAALLGRSPSWQGSHPDYGTANTLFKLSNTYIELLAPCGEGLATGQINAVLDGRDACLGGLVFGTTNADAFIAHARAQGLAASDPVPGHGVDANTGARRSWRNIFWDAAAARGVFSFCIEHESGSSLPEAVATGQGAITAVDHVVVRTQSVEAAKQFYGEQLGIRLALEQHVPEWGGTQLFFRASSMSIEVIASATSPAQDELWGLALASEDLDATHARLIESGIEVSEMREGRKQGTRVCTVKSHTLNTPTLLIEHSLAQ